MKRIRTLSTLLVLAVAGAAPALGQGVFEEAFLFDPQGAPHGHVHASCIVETPEGGLLAVWYENGVDLGAGYYNERKDKSDDVRIGGARKLPGKDTWEAPFVMTDTFGVSDNNPCMIIDAQERLWLIYPTLLGVPDWTWGSALVRYRIASSYEAPGAPVWNTSDILVPHPSGFAQVLEDTRAVYKERAKGTEWEGRIDVYLDQMAVQLEKPLATRIGWMPRAHPLVRSDGALLLPLSNENFSIAMMAITKDGGETWTLSNPVPEAGLTQPTLVEFDDGTITAFFRNSSPEHRIKRSDSTDGGMSWSAVSTTDLLHPGAGIEALLLENGHLLMIYNDVEDSPRDKMAVSISEDRGKTWKWTRHLEDIDGGRFDYPSIVQGKDGRLHASYSYNLATIKYVHFDEAWVQAGD